MKLIGEADKMPFSRISRKIFWARWCPIFVLVSYSDHEYKKESVYKVGYI